MRNLINAICVLAVMALGFWAYSENYKTQAAMDEVARLQSEIGALMETQAVLRAEWAYLNRPDRLRDLAELNFGQLGLVPLQPSQFGHIEQIAYPPVEIEQPQEIRSLPPDVIEALYIQSIVP